VEKKPETNLMDIIQILQEDYQRFPAEQTYSIYAKNVFFKDPLIPNPAAKSHL